MPLGATRFGFSAGEIPLEVEYIVIAGGGGSAQGGGGGGAKI